MKKTLFFLSTILLSVSCSVDEELEISQENENISKNHTTAAKPLINVTNVIAGQDANLVKNGDFIKIRVNNVDHLFFIFKGTLRHIDSILTWNGLFSSNKTFAKTYYSFSDASLATSRPIGSPLYADNGLLKSNSDGKIYFREGSTLCYIPSLQIFNQYKFNQNLVQPTVSISVFNGQYVALAYGVYTSYSIEQNLY